MQHFKLDMTEPPSTENTNHATTAAGSATGFLFTVVIILFLLKKAYDKRHNYFKLEGHTFTFFQQDGVWRIAATWQFHNYITDPKYIFLKGSVGKQIKVGLQDYWIDYDTRGHFFFLNEGKPREGSKLTQEGKFQGAQWQGVQGQGAQGQGVQGQGVQGQGVQGQGAQPAQGQGAQQAQGQGAQGGPPVPMAHPVSFGNGGQTGGKSLTSTSLHW